MKSFAVWGCAALFLVAVCLTCARAEENTSAAENAPTIIHLENFADSAPSTDDSENPPDSFHSVKIHPQREKLLETAKKYIGTPYRARGDTAKGFDCSGFIWFVYRNGAGMDMPRSSQGIWASGAENVKLEDALPGDVLVFSSRPGGKGSINHSALVVDKDSIIHAVSDGPKTGVLISPMTDSYFGPRIIGVKRFLKE